MKIVMLCEFFNEGLEYQENLLLKYYLKHGHSVAVITSTYESVFDFIADRHDKWVEPSVIDRGRARIFRLRYRYNFLNKVRAYTSIAAILEEEQPDLIFVHDIIPNVLEAVAYKKRHPACRMIMDYHADYSNSGKNWLSLKILHGVIRRWFLNRARRHLSGIFPVVPASAAFLNEVYGVPLADMELLPLGADTDLVREAKARGEGRARRAELGIAPGDIVVFTGGKLAPAKQTHLLIEAFRAMNLPSVHLVVVGETPKVDAAYKEKLAHVSAGLRNLHFTGWLNTRDIYSYLDMADVAVFPASQSILWQQAIAMGLPLLVGNTGHQDISYLNLYDNIVILPREQITAEHIRQALERIVRDSKLRQNMADGASRVSSELLNWDTLIHKTLRFNSGSATGGRL